MDSEAGRLHCPFSVEPGNCSVEFLGGTDVQIAILFPAPDTEGVPSDLHVAKCEAQGSACGTCHRLECRKAMAADISSSLSHCRDRVAKRS